MYGLVELDTGSLVSAGHEGSVKVWEPDHTTEADYAYTLVKSFDLMRSMYCCCKLDDGRVVSGGGGERDGGIMVVYK